MKKNLGWIAFGVLFALVTVMLTMSRINSKKFYVMTMDDGKNLIGTMHGSTWPWQPCDGCYVVRDIYLIRAVNPQNPAAGMKVIAHGDDVYWPWETFVSKSKVRLIEPINWDSPLGNAVKQANAQKR